MDSSSRWLTGGQGRVRSGIVSYGTFIPRFRLAPEEVWKTWAHRHTAKSTRNVIGVSERTVNRWDEDPTTMAVEAVREAIGRSGLHAQDVGALIFGSCTSVFATKPACPTIAEAAGLSPAIQATDCQFAAKSGTAALQICHGLVLSRLARFAMAVGADSMSKHVAPNTYPQEYTSGAAAGALLLGSVGQIATIEGVCSYVTDTPDYFRLEGDRYIVRGVHEDEESIGFEEHIESAVKAYLERHHAKPSDFDFVVLPNANKGARQSVLKDLGFSTRQAEAGTLTDRIGDTGSAAPLLGLSAVLDQANPGQRILLTAYGFGAGADAIGLRVTDRIAKYRMHRAFGSSTIQKTERKEYLGYEDYLRMERKLLQEYY